MGNLFAMYATATRALQTNTYMISTASHNLANAETEGFSRQRVHLVTSPAQSVYGVGQIGKGVDISTVKRLRDEFLDDKIRYETSSLSKYETTQEGLDHIETIFKEPSNSNLSSMMSGMWNAWKSLAGKPDLTNRTLVAQRADEMAKGMNHMANQLDTLKTNTVNEIEGMAYNANALLDKIQATTEEIHQIKNQGMEPNDLLDQRDLYLEQLSAIVNINVQEDSTGRVRITEADSGNNYELLNFKAEDPPAYKMSVIHSAEYDGTAWKITIANGGDQSKMTTLSMAGAPSGSDGTALFKAGDVLMADNPLPNDGGITNPTQFEGPYRPQLGSIAGAQNAIEKADEYMADLDNLAYTVASVINTVHTIDEKNDVPFFTVNDPSGTPSSFPQDAPPATSPKGAAKNIKVHSSIMSDSSLIDAGVTADAAANDGQRADQIAKLQDLMVNMSDIGAFHTQLASYDASTMTIKGDVSGSTPNGFHTQLIGKIGVDSQSSKNNITNQTSLLEQLEMKRQSTSGVSIDEEVSDLMRFMSAYQANARVVNTITQMLDTLISLGQ